MKRSSQPKPSRKNGSVEKPSRVRTWLLPIMPPLTTGILGIVSTLLITGHLWPRHNEGTATAATSGAKPPVLDAPFVYFSSKKIDYSLVDCLEKAKADVERAGLTGRENKRNLAWGYQKETTGIVWCNTDDNMVVYIAAGRNDQQASELAEVLRKSF